MALVAAIWLATAPAAALEEEAISAAEAAAASVRAELQTIEQAVVSPIVTNDKLQEFRGSLDGFRSDLLAAGARLDAPIGEIKAQIAKLPAAPKDGETEAPEIAAQRKLLNDMASRLSGAQSQVNVLIVEVDQTLTKILNLQRDRFFKQILEPHSSILAPTLWSDAMKGISAAVERSGAWISALWASSSRDIKWLRLLVVVLSVTALLAFSAFVQRIWRRRFFPEGSLNAAPDSLSRLWRVLWSVSVTFIMSWVALLALAVALTALGFSRELGDGQFNAIFSLMIEVPAVLVLIKRLAEPSKPAWRLLPIDDWSARQFSIAAYAAAILAGVTSGMGEAAAFINLPVDNSIAISAVSSLAMAGILGFATLNLRDRSPTPVTAAVPAGRAYYNWARNFRVPVWAVIYAAAAALLLGYIALASYLVFNLFYTLVIIAILFLVEYLAEAAARSASDPLTALGKMFRRRTGWSTKNIERSELVFRTSVDLLLVIVGLPILIGLWAVNWIDFRSIANRVFFSFEIGNVTISPWTILLVIVLLALGVAMTKLFSRWLDRRILSHAHLDRGVQESVRTAVNYAGYIIAIGFALSAAGIDFSSFALIAGALGVGIGLGFQSVVNNFVSGIILLAERPVRIGDWIVTDAGEGLVKRIKVRSTEIETFDGCSVIVPNSDLIMKPVKNWTLGSSMGKAAIGVAIDHGQDADAVRELLLKVVAEHPKILHFPEPSVVVSKLALHGIEFDIRGTVSDIFDASLVASEIRVTILKEFANRNIVMAKTSGGTSRA